MKPGDLVRFARRRGNAGEATKLSVRPGPGGGSNPIIAEMSQSDIGLVLAVDKSWKELCVLTPGGFGWNIITYFELVEP
jgi:hypothetical protein